MLLLGLDLETGNDFDKPLEENFITEIGLVLWDTDHGPVEIYSKLLNLGREISPDCVEYTGITNEVREKFGETDIHTIAEKVAEMFRKADYIVAHNGLEFDSPVMDAFFRVYFTGGMDKKVWVDTMIDIPFPNNCKSRNLTYLAGFHIILNCFPHRAITDVLTMLTIMMKYDLEEILKSANSPIIECVWTQAYPNKRKTNDPKKFIIEMAEFDRRKDLAKANGFRWDSENKLWLLKCREIKKPNIDLPYIIRSTDEKS